MGHYIPHKRRKIRSTRSDCQSKNAAPSDTIERKLALRREAERLEGEGRRAARSLRALERRVERRSAVVDGASGRRRTAARLAGVAIISASLGLRTRALSIRRPPNSTPSELWEVDFTFENEQDFAFYFNDPMKPAEIDAIHLLRYAAPRIAEEIVTGSATAGADDRNNKAVLQLAESYANKLFKRSSLSEDDRQALATKIVGWFERTAVSRFECFHTELSNMVEVLMTRTRLSRRQCERILCGVYARREAPRLHIAKPLQV
ncbi:hypothetical protein [Methylocystis bryophila]|uniref:Uncharacterized protein n=1 Tax=Methylocystis bryophila TaxID=655015 RepID=A0A1W6N208_9HYPH|nr:hypothetical protein [Methylocystis bryophila]ARN83894.1 hypothetical protein B1812_21680 [Methylocystis bryophila]BDV40990.1 hypothetical protein DSM21852_42440 [Methylocystis bryophila]